jgi:hypothetical protein
MAQDRVVFVPWNQSQSGKFGTDGDWSNKQKANTHHKRNWTTYYLDTAGTPLKQLGMGVGARLHIFAHGSPDDGSQCFPDVAGPASVTPAQLADLIEQKGLPKRYMGTVVCDICYSALGAPSFAKGLARQLFSRGYVCATMGHTGALYPVYFRYGEFKTNEYEHRMVELLDGANVKSKYAQERFWGFT